MSVKSIYVARRNPGTNHAEFLENWRGHARLAARFAAVVDVYDAVTQCRPSLEADPDPAFDGVNLLQVRSLPAAVELQRRPGIERLRVDELRVFAEPVEQTKLITHETVLVDRPHGRVVLLEFIRRSASSTADLIAAWSGEEARAKIADPAFVRLAGRLVHNHTILPPPPSVPFDGVGETWFESLDDAREYVDEARHPGHPAYVVDTRILMEVHHRWIRP